MTSPETVASSPTCSAWQLPIPWQALRATTIKALSWGQTWTRSRQGWSQPGPSTLFDTASYTAGEDATIANSTWGSRSNTSDLSISQQALRGARQPQLCLHWTRRNWQTTTKSLSTVQHPELAATTGEICYSRAGWIRQNAGMSQIRRRSSWRVGVIYYYIPARHWRCFRFWGIFWIDAGSTESLERGYLQIAKGCGLEPHVDAVKRWLSNISESWALILDNADYPHLDISPYFPMGNRGIVLITTRNPDCQIHATVGSYELGAMEPDEAVILILKTTEVSDQSDKSIRKSAGRVVTTLGYLAPAIVQAGAVIRQGCCTMEEYCAVYYQRRRELLSQKAVQDGEDYRYTVYTTWEVSLKMIEDRIIVNLCPIPCCICSEISWWYRSSEKAKDRCDCSSPSNDQWCACNAQHRSLSQYVAFRDQLPDWYPGRFSVIYRPHQNVDKC